MAIALGITVVSRPSHACVCVLCVCVLIPCFRLPDASLVDAVAQEAAALVDTARSHGSSQSIATAEPDQRVSAVVVPRSSPQPSDDRDSDSDEDGGGADTSPTNRDGGHRSTVSGTSLESTIDRATRPPQPKPRPRAGPSGTRRSVAGAGTTVSGASRGDPSPPPDHRGDSPLTGVSELTSDRGETLDLASSAWQQKYWCVVWYCVMWYGVA